MSRYAILLAILALPISAAPADVAVSVGSRQAVLIAQDNRFEPALQLASEAEVGVALSVPVRRVLPAEAWVSAGAAVGLTGESRLRDGYSYRAVVARSVWLRASGYAHGGTGFEVGLKATIAGYLLSSLIFVYPEVEAGPAWRLRLGSGVVLVVAMPVSWQFRQDLATSATVGVRTVLAVETPGATRYTRR